ncbi:hypothetical protein [Streptomyces sp. Isolate_45]|uniref:hypothetical protein n=1 Tax=Streptomyces sp. Isolate_45 TaxID=2950111 RepID=UPI0024820E79|nr:hypothetical protein [Streptomyces sp. Isolate_45]MDA5281215.1 hypothetical protein [Streptomyces sp. Isolate_45]
MTAEPDAPAGAGAGEPVGPAGVDPSVRETVEEIVRAVRDGNDAAIRTLPAADLADVADIAASLYLRERLYADQ